MEVLPKDLFTVVTLLKPKSAFSFPFMEPMLTIVFDIETKLLLRHQFISTKDETFKFANDICGSGHMERRKRFEILKIIETVRSMRLNVCSRTVRETKCQ